MKHYETTLAIDAPRSDTTKRQFVRYELIENVAHEE